MIGVWDTVDQALKFNSEMALMEVQVPENGVGRALKSTRA
jgi:hypothetical protein